MKKVSLKSTSRKTTAARPESYRKQLQTLLRRLVQESTVENPPPKAPGLRR